MSYFVLEHGSTAKNEFNNSGQKSLSKFILYSDISCYDSNLPFPLPKTRMAV
jgi:hypothetical protein